MGGTKVTGTNGQMGVTQVTGTIGQMDGT